MGNLRGGVGTTLFDENGNDSSRETQVRIGKKGRDLAYGGDDGANSDRDFGPAITMERTVWERMLDILFDASVPQT